MKKTSTMLVAAMVCGVVYADIAIELKNNGGVVYVAGTSGTVTVDEAFVQLIWTSETPLQQAGVGGSLGRQSTCLSSLTTTATYAGTWSDQPQGIITYSDSNVGGNNINDGWLFVRIFDNAALEIDDYYLQQYVQGPNLTESTPTVENPSPIPYDTNLSLGGALDSQGYQIIPEPAVASLIGIAGIGFLFTRRLFGRN